MRQNAVETFNIIYQFTACKCYRGISRVNGEVKRVAADFSFHFSFRSRDDAMTSADDKLSTTQDRSRSKSRVVCCCVVDTVPLCSPVDTVPLPYTRNLYPVYTIKQSSSKDRADIEQTSSKYEPCIVPRLHDKAGSS